MPAGTVLLPSPNKAGERSTHDLSPAATTAALLPAGFRESFRKWDPSVGIAGEVNRWEVLRLESVLEACEGEREEMS